jgi:rod shape-determining protein MreD
LKPTIATDAHHRRIPFPEIGVFLLIGLGVEVIQGSLLPPYLRAHVLLVFVLYVGWRSTPLRAAFVGTVFGLLQDYLFGIPLGLNGLSKTLLGFVAGYLSRWTTPELGVARVVLLVGLALMDRSIILGTLLLLGQRIPSPPALELTAAAALTGLLGEVFFRLYDKIRFPPKDFRRL